MRKYEHIEGQKDLLYGYTIGKGGCPACNIDKYQQEYDLTLEEATKAIERGKRYTRFEICVKCLKKIPKDDQENFISLNFWNHNNYILCDDCVTDLMKHLFEDKVKEFIDKKDSE